MPGTRLTPAQQQLLRARLADIRTHVGALPNYLAAELTDTFGVSRATVYRHFAALDAAATPKQLAARTGGFELTTEMLPYLTSSYAATRKQAWQALQEHFPDAGVPGYPNFTKYLKTKVDTGLLAKCETGWGIGSRAHAAEPHTLQRSPYPGHRWAIDVKHMHVQATPDNRWAPADARSINIVDDFSGKLLVSLPVLGDVTAAHIVVALGQACHAAGGMLRHVDATLGGGIAETVHADNGTENAADEVRRFIEQFGSRRTRSKSYRKRANGRVERYHLDLETASRTLPTHSRAAKDRTDAPLLHGQPVITLTALALRLEQQRLEHNSTVHAGRTATPNQLHDTPELSLLPVPAAALAEVALPDPHKQGFKTMDGDGLLLWGTKFTAPALFSEVGKKFRLRYWPTDRSVVYVLSADERTFVTVATPTQTAGADIRRATTQHNATVDAAAVQAHKDGAAQRLAADGLAGFATAASVAAAPATARAAARPTSRRKAAAKAAAAQRVPGAAVPAADSTRGPRAARTARVTRSTPVPDEPNVTSPDPSAAHTGPERPGLLSGAAGDLTPASVADLLGAEPATGGSPTEPGSAGR